MERRRLDNKTLDSIGQRLVKGASVPEADLDRVVANPELFSLVVARADRLSAGPASHSALFLFIRQNALVFAGAAILLIIVVGVASLLRPEKGPLAQKESRVPAGKSDVVAPPVFPPQEVNSTGKHSAGGDDNEGEFDESKDEFTVQHAIHRPQGRISRRRPVEPVRDAGDDFYPVTYTGDTADTAAGGRIIRVELKRSSLFALGVNLPLENDVGEMVTADLLVGRDGVTRGVRVVN